MSIETAGVIPFSRVHASPTPQSEEGVFTSSSDMCFNPQLVHIGARNLRIEANFELGEPKVSLVEESILDLELARRIGSQEYLPHVGAAPKKREKNQGMKPD